MKRIWILLLLLAGFVPAQVIPHTSENSPAGEEGEEPTGGRDFDFWSYTINMLLALGVVIGLIFLVAWLFRGTVGRRMSLGSKGLLQMVNSVPMGDRRFISVLRVGERYYLVGITSAEINLLAELDPEEVKRYLEGDSEPERTGFAKLLSRLRGGQESGK